MRYAGIADAHGIESFIPFQCVDPKLNKVIEKMSGEPVKTDLPTLSYLMMRAGANRHRHTVVYMVEVSKKNAKTIENLLAGGKYKDALTQLKSLATEVSIEKHREKSWKMIPNDDLDPYYPNWSDDEK